MVKRHADNKIYAMKKIKMEGISEKNKQNALTEIRILASINHPYIVGYKDSFLESGKNTLNIVMDYCGEGDLYKKILKMKQKGTSIAETQIWDVFG
jgi:NIMA (never in mitosis gene a)-related kinase